MPAHVYVSLMQQRNPSLVNKSKTVPQQNNFSKYNEYAGHRSKAQSVPKLLPHPASGMALPIFSFSFWEWSLLPAVLRIMPKYCPGSVLLQAKPTHTHKQVRTQSVQSSQSVPIQVHALVIGRLQVQILCLCSGVWGTN